MAVTTALAVVPSADLATARAWWTQLLGREPDRVPMPSDVEWLYPSGADLQLVDDAAHAGAGSVTLGVEDVDAELVEVAGRGLEVPAAQTVPTGQFRIAMLQDPTATPSSSPKNSPGEVLGADRGSAGLVDPTLPPVGSRPAARDPAGATDPSARSAPMRSPCAQGLYQRTASLHTT